MDKFSEYILLKKTKISEIKQMIDNCNCEILKLLNKKRTVNDIYLHLDSKLKENENLIFEIINFSKTKKRIIISCILLFLIVGIIYALPFVLISLLSKSSVTIFVALGFEIIFGFYLYKDCLKKINEKKQKIGSLTVENLECDNIQISQKIKKINIEKSNIETLISDIKKKIKQLELEKDNLKKNINFIESIRNEVIERLCTDTLNKEFEIEQGKPSFQKMIKK